MPGFCYLNHRFLGSLSGIVSGFRVYGVGWSGEVGCWRSQRGVLTLFRESRVV